MADDHKGPGRIIAVILVAILVLYLFFPVFLIWPVEEKLGREIVYTIFAPQRYMYEHMDWYRKFLDWQCDVVGIE